MSRTALRKKYFKLLAVTWPLVLILACPLSLLGFLIPGHEAITTKALARLAADRLIPQKVQHELIKGSSNPDLTESGLLFTNSRYDPKYHFDNDGDYGQVCLNFDAVNRLIGDQLALTDPDPWAFGRILHAIEDFYSHSNYVPLYLEYKESSGEMKGSAPPIEEVWLDPVRYKGFISMLKRRLRTGRYPDHGPLANEADHGIAVLPFTPGMNKDSFVREFNDEAKQSAESAAVWYIQLYLRDSKRIALWLKVKGACTLQEVDGSTLEQAQQSISAFFNSLKANPSPQERSEAALGLGYIGNAQAIPALTDALSRDQNVSVRKYAAEALGLIGTGQVIDPLLNTISTNQPLPVQAAAVESLGMVRTKSAHAAILELLKSKNRDIRASAVTALAHEGSEDAYSVIRPLLDDPDVVVIERSVWALGELRSALAVRALSDILLNSTTIKVREQSALALGRIGSKEAIPALQQITGRRNEYPAVRVASTEALGFFEDAGALATLRALLADPSSKVRAMAAYSSVQLRSQDAAPIIRELLSDKDRGLRREVIAAMGQWPEEFVDALGGVVSNRAAEDYDRLLGLEALDQLPPREEVDGEVRKLLDAQESQIIQAAAVNFLKQRPSPDNGRALIGFYERPGLDQRIRSLSRVIVPFVGSLDNESAQSRIRAAGLKVSFLRKVPHDKLPDGGVILQIPLSGVKTNIGGSVGLYESSGPNPKDGTELPDLIGDDATDARKALEERGLKPQVFSATECPAGQKVMFQLPGAGKRVMPGAEVYVFRGGADSKEPVPDFIGRDVRQVVQRDKEWPFFFFFRESKDQEGQWKIFAQSPEAGSKAYCGTWVILDYSVPLSDATAPN